MKREYHGSLLSQDVLEKKHKLEEEQRKQSLEREHRQRVQQRITDTFEFIQLVVDFGLLVWLLIIFVELLRGFYQVVAVLV